MRRPSPSTALLPLLLPSALGACASPRAESQRPATPTAEPAPPASSRPVPPPTPAPLDLHRVALFARVAQGGTPAVVREVRTIAVLDHAIRFPGLPQDFDAHGVSLRATKGVLDVHEMRSFGTFPTMRGLAGGHLGRRVRVTRPVGPDGASGGGPAKEEEGTLVGLDEPRALVALPSGVEAVDLAGVTLEGAPTSPRLEANVDAEASPLDVELTYSTSQLSCSVSYRLVRIVGTTRGSLGGYATLTNDTGVDLADAMVTMTADSPQVRDFAQAWGPVKGGPGSPGGDTQAIHFAAPLSVPSGQSIAAHLFGPTDVALTRRIVIEGPSLPTYEGMAPGELSNASVRAVLDATAASGAKLSPLGMLAGATELFEAEAAPNDPPRWYGATNSRPLPGGLGLRVDLGDERQFEIRRRLVSTKTLQRCVSESSWELSVTNPTEEPIPFEDVEPVSGDYTILDSSLPVTAKERDYFAFGFSVPGKGTTRMKFRVKVSSCVEAYGRRGYWYTGASKSPGKAKPGYASAP